MSVVYLDTQVVIWLHSSGLSNLTEEAKRQIEANDLLISPMVLLEMEYLFDRKRSNTSAMNMYMFLHTALGLTLCSFPFSAIAKEALSCKWTRDPFDRVIVSHAKANDNATLITSDRKMRQHYPAAKW